jgi:hypothetical protein
MRPNRLRVLLFTIFYVFLLRFHTYDYGAR